jgi:hypothetical protein
MWADKEYTQDPNEALCFPTQHRALRLLHWLSARPEQHIAVVTHLMFLRNLKSLFGADGTLAASPESAALELTAEGSPDLSDYKNCELRSFDLFTDGTPS